jgi:hypothetical protein
VKVLIVLNENPLGSHTDLYEAFELLAAEALIEGFDVYPYLLRRSEGLGDADIAAEIHDMARDGLHEVIVWMHTGQLRVLDSALNAIERLPSRPTMMYWEGDAYHPWYRRTPEEMLTIMRHCRLVFVPCGGPMLRVLARAGVGEVRYAPSCTSGKRFPHVWRAERDYHHDVVMIGNRVGSRIPFRTWPGARMREALVKALERRYGARFAVYGQGWTGPSAQGPCRFDDQGLVYALAKVAIGVDNTRYAWAFSDRLPIAMACGIPLVYNGNPGFRDVFGAEFADTFFEGIGDAITHVDRLLLQDNSSLQLCSARNRRFFETDLSMVVVARHVISQSALLALSGRENQKRTLAQATEYTQAPAASWQRIPPLAGGDRA